MSERQNPVDAFKQHTAACVRALARRDDIEVSFVPSGQGLVGKEARLTMPGRELPVMEATKARGEADAVALRLRHHNDELHGHHRPRNPEAREVFDAVEQSRCEALGMRRMAGLAANLDANLEDHCRSKGYGRVTSREDVPLAEAMGALVREALTGIPLPPSARAMLDLWRPALGAGTLAGSWVSQASGATGCGSRTPRLRTRFRPVRTPIGKVNRPCASVVASGAVVTRCPARNHMTSGV